MEVHRLRWCIFCLAMSTVISRVVHSQTTAVERNVGDCASVTIALLQGDSSGAPSNTGLVSQSYVMNDGTFPPVVRILNFNVVCEAPGLMKNTISSFSVLVEYECQSIPTCGPVAVNRTEQFQFDCNSGASFIPLQVRGDERTLDPLATFSTPIDIQCGQCAEPESARIQSSNITHCAACVDCVEGQRRCIGTSGLLDPVLRCCNWYLNNVCQVTCPDPLVGDPATFDCGCGRLDVLNGATTYSNAFLPGSTATHVCAQGYRQSGDSQQTCSLDNGWSGTTPTCSRIDCGVVNLTEPMFGSINFESTLYLSVVLYSCDPGYDLVGDASRTCEEEGWSGESPTCVPGFIITHAVPVTSNIPIATSAPSRSACGTPCIVGIVLAILGAIILAGVLVGVAYAIYAYKNHPDTKLAKYDADKINGVARDNPLYVDPDAVVGDGAEAA